MDNAAFSPRSGVLTRRTLLRAAAFGATTATLPVRAGERRAILDDASRLNPTPVARHAVRRERGDDLVAVLRRELKEAADAGRPVCASAARHSMGGQSLPRDGTALTLDSRRIDVDTAARTYRADAGARWSDVIARLDPLGFSPTVMQSNNDFAVASTFCVNAHGWPAPHGPFGSTVRSVRLLLADGNLVTCSHGENAELFALAMGGYGLFGIIVDLEVEMTENLNLAERRAVMPAADFARQFVEAVTGDPTVRMAYGRLSLTRHDFFHDALLVTYRPHEGSGPPALASAAGRFARLTNEVYRSQIGHEVMKSARWAVETRVAPLMDGGVSSRNTLMDEPVSNLANTDPRRTDILHEYFVAPERFGDFLAVCRDLIPKAKAEFINVTLRYVAPDPTAVLAYAKVPRIAAVMSFSQEMTTDGEVDMMALTERLIDGVVAIGGSFYLPYRLHARRDQVEAAYPDAARFVAQKRQHDPKLIFRNAMWQTYFA